MPCRVPILHLAVGGCLLAAMACGSAREGADAKNDVAPAAREPPAETPAGLAGTSWQLVEFRDGDETILTPDDRSKYMLTFEPGGRLAARIDCNRGSGTWKSSGSPQLELGPMALTRAMCPPGSLHDQLVKQLPYVRSYIMRDGHLFLSLMADGGIYEFEPAGTEGSMTGAIKGTATYRERMALPPGAVLEATLENVSRADAPSELVGRTRIEQPGNPPIRFEIPFDTSRIDPRGRYTVRATITVDGKPFFTTDQHHPVLTGGGGSEVKLLLRRVGTSTGSDESLENTYWKLTHLEGAPVGRDFQRREPHLIFNSLTRRVTGSGGCNQLTGGYEVSGDRLQLSQVASTMMACLKGMETERAFLQTIERVSGWRISGKQLELLDADGKAIARFDGLHMK
jgi:putative lipoprotein